MGYRYIGAKSSILSHLLKEIGDTVPKGSTVADLMCGTATVSAALRAAGFSVIANDVMTYSYHHSRVRLLLSEPPAFKKCESFIQKFYNPKSSDLFGAANNYERVISCLNDVSSKKGYFFKEFSPGGKPRNFSSPRSYFSTENAMKIDGIRTTINELADKKCLSELENSLLIHDLLMAANDIANIAGTYGHHLSRLTGRATDPMLLKPSEFTKPKHDGRHKVMLGYAEDVAQKIVCDLCYIDPPYIKRQYAANYHILETIARGDEPVAMGKSGLRPWRDQYSDFCTKTKIRDAFRKIILNIKCPNILVSYSEDGLLTKSELHELLSEFGAVKLKEFTHKRFKSRAEDSKLTISEFLFNLRRKT